MSPRSRTAGGALAAALAMTCPAVAAAPKPKPPRATTLAAHDVTQTTAALRAYVNPEQRHTVYRFQYGTTASYGSQTPQRVAGDKGLTTVKDVVQHLAPSTTYHFRVMAHSSAGTTFGGDKTFTTREGAPAVSLTASRSRVVFGGGVFLTGALSGSRIAGRSAVLQSRAYPFQSAWHTLGSPKLTDTAGKFGFGIAPITVSTEYRVTTGDKPRGTSAPVTVRVALRVRTEVSSRRVRAHRHVLFSGTVRPAHDGAQFAIQRRRQGLWTTIAGGTTTHNDATSSQFAARVSIAHTGYYRVYVRSTDGAYDSSVGRKKHIVVHH